MADDRNKILERCSSASTPRSDRPGSRLPSALSRQRIRHLQHRAPRRERSRSLLARLLGDEREVKLTGAAPFESGTDSPEERAAKQAWDDQRRSSRSSARSRRTRRRTRRYRRAGSLRRLPAPPAASRSSTRGSIRFLEAGVGSHRSSSRSELAIRTTRPQAVTLTCAEKGVDRVIPNARCWRIEQQTQKRFGELFADRRNAAVARDQRSRHQGPRTLDILTPAEFGPDSSLTPTPRAETDESAGRARLASAVLGQVADDRQRHRRSPSARRACSLRLRQAHGSRCRASSSQSAWPRLTVAIVHDAQRDQRELYKSIREQLDALPEAKTNPGGRRLNVLVTRARQEVHLVTSIRARSTRACRRLSLDGRRTARGSSSPISSTRSGW